MSEHPNIYDAVVFDLHPRVKEFLDSLDQSGQIDRDDRNTPHVISIEKPTGSVYKCLMMRNGTQQNFVLHTRKKVDPIKSWMDDGWVRPQPVQAKAEIISRKERDRQVHPFESIVEQILSRR